MADGGQDEVDWREELISIENSLSSVRKNLTSVILNIPPAVPAGANFTVLSWNTESKKNKEKSRDCWVSRVVDHVNPDVLLLQGFSNKRTITCINHRCKPRSYTNCVDDANDVKVLYDPSVFGFESKIDLSDVLFPEEDEKTDEDQEIFKGTDTMATFELKHKRTRKKIIFMSFENYDDEHDDDEHNKRRAEGFCKLVSRTALIKNMLVVAGADLCCSDFSRGLARIAKYKYDASSRSEDQVTNNFISAWPDDVTVEDHISVLNPDNSSPMVLSNVFKGSVDEYKDSLHCDPLVYRLRVSNV